MSLRFSISAVATLLFVLPAAHAATLLPSRALESLTYSVIERNALADQVALSKWDSHKAVFDPIREQQLLDSVRQKALRYALAPDDAARFQLGQMEANRLIQYQLLDQWHRQKQAPTAPRTSLGEIRQHLDALQDRQMKALAEIAPFRQQPDCAATTSQTIQQVAKKQSLDNVHHVALIRSLGDLCQ